MEKSEFDLKYEDIFNEYTNLQNDQDKLEQNNIDAKIQINGYLFENNRLQTLLDIKHQEIADLNETLKLYTPQSPIDLNARTILWIRLTWI